MNWKKLAVVVGILVALAVYFSTGGDQLLNPQAYQSWYRQAPVATAVSFFFAYLVGTALSLPVTAVLSVVAGLIFGHLLGIPLALLACTIGGTLAYLSSRYVLHDLVQDRFANHLTAVNRGLEKDGAFYLFSLRMIAVIPFWLLNLLMGVTPISAGRFFVATLTGMLPITAVLVHFGTQLGAVETFSLRSMFTPGLLLSLALLGSLPFVAKAVVALVKTGRSK